jgi:hypothetical protein
MTKYLKRAEKTDPGRDISEYLSLELLKRTVVSRTLDDDKERWKCPSCFFTDKKTQQPLQCCYDVLKTRSLKHEAEEEEEEEEEEWALRKRRRSLEIEELELKQLRLANEKLQLELDAQRLSNEKRRESNTGLRLALDEDELKKDVSRISPKRP